MKLEKIDSSNERNLSRYVEGLVRKYTGLFDKRNEEGFNKYIEGIKKAKSIKDFERLAIEVRAKKDMLKDLEKSIEETYGIKISTSSYCSSDKPFKYEKDYERTYEDGKVTIKEDSRCDYKNSSAITKAILEKDVATANKLISELEVKAGVEQ